MHWFIITLSNITIRFIDRYHPRWLEGSTVTAVTWADLAGHSPYCWVYTAAAASISAVILVITLRSFSQRMIQATFQRPIRRLLLGLVVLIVVPALSYLLIITTLGIPLAILLLTALAFYLILAGLYSGIAVGAWLFRFLTKNKSFCGNWQSALVGTVTLTLVTLIPYLGWAIGALVYCWVLGTLTTMKFDALK